MAGLYRGKVQSDCPITYVQNKKYPTSSEKVYPNYNVTNKGLLKNPYNTVNEPVGQLGERPKMITTDMYGNVYARSITETVSNVSNSTLLKNPHNLKEEVAPEKKVLSMQRIKDINSKSLPDFLSGNKGITELAMKLLLMITNPQIKLVTIALMKLLVTKNANHPELEKERQKIIGALNLYNQLLASSRNAYKNFGGSDTSLNNALLPLVQQYETAISQLLPFINSPPPANINEQISQQLAELAILSNSLTRMFEQNNIIDPSTVLTTQQILDAGQVNPLMANPVAIPATGQTPNAVQAPPAAPVVVVANNVNGNQLASFLPTAGGIAKTAVKVGGPSAAIGATVYAGSLINSQIAPIVSNIVAQTAAGASAVGSGLVAMNSIAGVAGAVYLGRELYKSYNRPAPPIGGIGGPPIPLQAQPAPIGPPAGPVGPAGPAGPIEKIDLGEDDITNLIDTITGLWVTIQDAPIQRREMDIIRRQVNFFMDKLRDFFSAIQQGTAVSTLIETNTQYFIDYLNRILDPINPQPALDKDLRQFDFLGDMANFFFGAQVASGLRRRIRK